ncbi:MAG TPA: putative zinc-binding metallopeptidase [bacterium]
MSAPRAAVDLDRISEDELLSLRLCDLPVGIEGTWLADCIRQLYEELAAQGLVFRPDCYLADEWLTPENEPVIGIPFFLAHPALTRLERKMMLEAEGGTRDWCMKLLRHEAGHAICYAYRLHRTRRWQRIFGRSSQEYGDTYKFRPYSKSFVRHLAYYYAQHHPDEDFVETFAVWLTPGLDWTRQYQGWKALEKLQFVDQLMRELRGRPPLVARGRKHWRIRTLRSTLRNYYRRRQSSEAEDYPEFHDANLRQIFAERAESGAPMPAALPILRQYRKLLIDVISRWTGQRKYLANELLGMIMQRCRALRLVTAEPEPVVVLRVAAYLTSLLMHYRYTGWYRGERRR